jgi:hypothetical protein
VHPVRVIRQRQQQHFIVSFHANSVPKSIIRWVHSKCTSVHIHCRANVNYAAKHFRVHGYCKVICERTAVSSYSYNWVMVSQVKLWYHPVTSSFPGEKPFTCQHCSRAFADRSNLRAHLQTHSDVKKYRCQLCSKTFSRMSLLTKHELGVCCRSSIVI